MSETEVSKSSDLTDGLAVNGKRGAKPGAILAAERVKQGWSVEQVADQLKLAPRQIVALEADQYSKLPGMAIVRGFVRAYAKQLKLDAGPLVAMIEVETGFVAETPPIRRDIVTPFAETRMPSMNGRSMTPLWIGGSVLVGVLIVGLTIAHLTGAKWPPSLSQLTKANDASASSSASVSMSASAAASSELPSTSATTDAASTALSIPVPSMAPVENRPQPAISTPTPTPTTASDNRAANAGSNTLVLKLRQDSWVEVRRSNGTVLLSRLMKAGTSETIEMTDPVQLVVGNVAGIEATLRGTQLNLKNGPGNTARVSLK